jgi:L-amino acid N-acyltransferase YncA
MPIRRAEPEDARAIVEVKVASWKVAYRGLIPDRFLDSMSADSRQINRWRERLEEGIGQMWVCEESGGIIGFVYLGASQDEDAEQGEVGEVYAMYLHPAEWRKGRGTELMAQAIEALQQEGYGEATLWVLHNNERGKRFYEAMGFEADGGEKVVEWSEGVELHEVRYRRVTCQRMGSAQNE